MNVRLLKVTVKHTITKDESLEDVIDKLEEIDLSISYDDYIRPMLIWSKTDRKTLTKALDVKKVVPKGAYIMGLFGGERKKGKEEYAGLIVKHFSYEGNYVQIRLHGLSQTYRVPKQLIEQYDVNVYKLFYRGLINPFKCKTYDVLLSSKGDEQLKSFLSEIINFAPNIPFDDRKKLEKLIEEVKTNLDVFEKDEPYVIYRCARAFTASVPENLDNAVSESHIAYIMCKNLQQAYYYAAVLNFLAYKVVESKRDFIRDQFARPLIAIVEAGLSWKDVPSDLRHRVANLSEKLSKTLEWKKYPSQDKALKELMNLKDFKEIVKTISEQISESNLKSSLSLVSGE
jgi:hypothetical protein